MPRSARNFILIDSALLLRTACCYISLFFMHGSVGWAQNEGAREHPLAPAIRLARQSLAAAEKIQEYEATFDKREYINNQLVSQRAMLKMRQQPFSVYLRFIEPNAGRQSLFVAGYNQNQILVKEGSGIKAVVPAVSLAIDSPLVKAENRHPITDIGIQRMLVLVLEQWEEETKYAESEVKYYPDAKLGQVACEVIENLHPRPRKQFKFHITRLFIEKQSRLPIRVENYAFPARPGDPPPIMEEYTYTNLKTNIGLTDADFDRANPQYSF